MNMWKHIIVYVIMVASAFISFWQSQKGFIRQIKSWRGFAFGIVVVFGLILIMFGRFEIKKKNEKIISLQEIAKIPTRKAFEDIMKQHREIQYHKMYKKLPDIYDSLEDKFKIMPSAEKKDPNIITATITSLFLSEGSDNSEPILFEDKMSPRPGISLYVWVEKCYEDVNVSKFSDIDKINTMIGKFVYESIYDKVLTYIKLDEEAGSTPSHGKNLSDKPIGEMEKMFIATTLKEIYLEKLPQTFDFQMLDLFDEERKKRVESIK